MPTKHPRIYLTLSVETLEKIDGLAVKHRMRRSEVVRKAVKEMARRDLAQPAPPEPDPTPSGRKGRAR